MTAPGAPSTFTTSQRLEGLVAQAQKVTQAAFVADVHALRARGYSTREISEALSASQSSVAHALATTEPSAPSPQVIEAARAFLAASTSGEQVAGAARAPQSSVVVFDVMREALTSVVGDYAARRMRSHDAHEREELLTSAVQISDRVDAVDPRDRDAQLAMTEELRELHARLQSQDDRA